MSPVRIQRKRTKNWRMPENTIYVGRPSRYGNPYQAGNDGDGNPEYLVGLFREFTKRDWIGDNFCKIVKEELRGKNLACWCALDKSCHADVLLEIANDRS